jgi:DNA-binding transcriptional LysR family regulator
VTGLLSVPGDEKLVHGSADQLLVGYLQRARERLTRTNADEDGGQAERTFERDGNREVQRVAGAVKAKSGDLLRALAVAGQGIVFQPTFIVGAEIASGKLLPILEDFHHSQGAPTRYIRATASFLARSARSPTSLRSSSPTTVGEGPPAASSQNEIAAEIDSRSEDSHPT